MNLMIYVYIAIGVILFIGISIAGSSHIYFNDALKKAKDMCSLGLPANEFAKKVILSKDLNVTINEINANVQTNYYHSKNKSLNISNKLYSDFSTAAIAITAHEIGHAISDKRSSATFRLKQSLAKFCYFLNRIFWLVLIASIICFFAITDIPAIGIGLLIGSGVIFIICLLFKFLTLSTEIEASKFAVEILKENNLEQSEIKKAKKLYRAAITTYIGDIFMPFVQLLNFLGFIVYNTIGRLFR